MTQYAGTGSAWQPAPDWPWPRCVALGDDQRWCLAGGRVTRERWHIGPGTAQRRV